MQVFYPTKAFATENPEGLEEKQADTTNNLIPFG
jgi:hypothetical protein